MIATLRRVFLTYLAAIALSASGLAQVNVAPSNSTHSWFVASMDRSALWAVDLEFMRVGRTGVLANFLMIPATPEIGKPIFAEMEVEFDCTSRRRRVNEIIATSSDNTQTRTNDSAALGWIAISSDPGDTWAGYLSFACEKDESFVERTIGPIPDASFLRDYYFGKFLGKSIEASTESSWGTYYRQFKACASRAAVDYDRLKSGDFFVYVEALQQACNTEQTIRFVPDLPSLDLRETGRISGELSVCATLDALRNLQMLAIELETEFGSKCAPILRSAGVAEW